MVQLLIKCVIVFTYTDKLIYKDVFMHALRKIDVLFSKRGWNDNKNLN